MFFGKLTLLYEPQAPTQVHGFDLFDRDLELRTEDDVQYIEPYQRIRELIDVQGLQRYVLLHQLEVETELGTFFRDNPHLQFKLVFLDAGEYSIVRTCIEEFWPRLTTGGLLIFDQFNYEVAPGETEAVRDSLPRGIPIRTFPNGWMPTAYVVKD